MLRFFSRCLYGNTSSACKAGQSKVCLGPGRIILMRPRSKDPSLHYSTAGAYHADQPLETIVINLRFMILPCI